MYSFHSINWMLGNPGLVNEGLLAWKACWTRYGRETASFSHNQSDMDLQQSQKKTENGSDMAGQKLALWVWNEAWRSQALEHRCQAQLASFGNIHKFLAAFLGLAWLALEELCSGFSLVSQTVSRASWLLYAAKLADEATLHRGRPRVMEAHHEPSWE